MGSCLSDGDGIGAVIRRHITFDTFGRAALAVMRGKARRCKEFHFQRENRYSSLFTVRFIRFNEIRLDFSLLCHGLFDRRCYTHKAHSIVRNVINTNMFSVATTCHENYVRFPLANLIQSLCPHQHTHTHTGCQLK